MKHIYILFSITFLISFTSFSQIEKERVRGIYYKVSLASTLSINTAYTLEQDDDSGPLINPSALFVNNTIGYQFDQRTMIGLNVEYNYHSQQGLHFLPAYLNLQHNIILDDTNVFVRGGCGTLLGMEKSFEKGSIYKLGVGIQEVFMNNNSLHFGLDFTRKRFGYKTLESLSSVSIFLEFMLF
ncbi:hypothetical protein QLS71_005435 [Mariniflexile litorale]|uniref:Outer membrane protein beta-barrel domain-containing protein n=1 Tax=Mariniflexile litorale TaxID=3045158 RepID=A0AAU7EH91_9FLAO|nr:hypothetical protein [Mariniflexile sp. KMM 9835]MDQ8211018.1 hypothetical protein [Mariniflexile sp. KMM 9835]